MIIGHNGLELNKIKMAESPELIAARREFVLQSYNSAVTENQLKYMEGDDKATAEYIFPNQKEDALNIVDMFYKNKTRVVSIQKKTKVGADGLMIEIAKLLTTHTDDNFVINPTNIRFLTAMSNREWEDDMIKKAPLCFKDKIFHHGQLSNSNIKNMKNGYIAIDESDAGTKEFQVLHNYLHDAGILDVEYLEKYNIRLVFISATMLKELYDLYRWGSLHETYKMTIPSLYIGHMDFLNLGIIKEFYPLNTVENANKWVQEDIIDYYDTDYRIHIVRVTEKTVNIVNNACNSKNIYFRNHTSTDRLSEDEINEFFREPLTKHIVLGVKGFFRRANLIPNEWKLRIGATHELYTRIVNNSVQVQGLPGRMTGYWRDVIEGGHKTGPYRTSIRAIEEYEKTYLDPFGMNSYKSAGFKKKNGRVTATYTMLSPKNIANLEAVDLPTVEGTTTSHLEEFATMEELSARWREINPSVTKDLSKPRRSEGIYKCSIGSTSQRYNIATIRELIGGTSMAYWGEGYTKAKHGDIIHRLYVGYDDSDVPIYVLRWAIKGSSL